MARRRNRDEAVVTVDPDHSIANQATAATAATAAPATDVGGPDAGDRGDMSGASSSECMKAGRLLVEGGHLSSEALASALQDANGDLLRFGTLLLSEHGVDRGQLTVAIANACGVPVGEAITEEIAPAVAARIGEIPARQHKIVPVAIEGNKVVVHAADPSEAHRTRVESEIGQQLSWRASDVRTVTSLIESMYRATTNLDQLVAAFAGEDEQRVVAETIAAVSLDDQAPVVQLVARIVRQALLDRASDVHFEPSDERLRIRFRIDGHLVESFSLPLSAHNALTSRLKIMADLNIVEKRVPQDGQFSTTIDGRDIDVRMSTVATVFGEKVVLRLLDKSKSLVGLAELGMPSATYKTYSKLVHAPFGMVICAGPTGAGKTTTLYATLQEINSTGKNVTTVEDPVEYVFPGINQVQTNERAGITFSTALKALLRQDPDTILVGEIRDADTARIAIQSALTGHFVLSSLHGTDAAAALHRLLDMGIEAFLVASSVVGVVSQRLLRKLCDNCREPYSPGAEELAVFKENAPDSKKTTFYQGTGCAYCSGTGFRDRTGVYELLRITPELRRLIVGWATAEEIRRLAMAQGMRTMLAEAMQLVEDDVTTIDEVVKTLFAY